MGATHSQTYYKEYGLEDDMIKKYDSLDEEFKHEIWKTFEPIEKQYEMKLRIVLIEEIKKMTKLQRDKRRKELNQQQRLEKEEQRLERQAQEKQKRRR